MPLVDDSADTTTGDGTLYYFGSSIVEDETRQYLVPNATGHVYATVEDALADTNRLAIFDMSGAPIANNALQSDYRGFHGPFRAPVPYVFVSFGSGIQEALSGKQIVDTLNTAQTIVTAVGDQVTGVAATVTTHDAQIQALITAVAALQAGGGGGGPIDPGPDPTDPPEFGKGAFGTGIFGK